MKIISLGPACCLLLLATAARCAAPPSTAPSRPATAPTPDYPAFHGGGALLGVAEPIGPLPLKLRWTYRTDDTDPAPVEAAAAIVGDTAYIADSRGILHAIDLLKGTARWKYTIPDGFGATPLVAGDKVMLGDLAGTFHAVSAANGTKLWTFPGNDPIHSSANLSGNTVCFGNDGGSIFALDATTGKQIWTSNAGDRVNSAPAISSGTVPAALFTGCDAHLRALAIKDGTELFNTDLQALCPGSPALLPDRIVAGTDGGRVLCFSADGQKQLWAFDGIGRGAMVYSSPAVADGVVVVGARDQAVHALDLQTGKELWSFATRGDVDSSPVISAGRAYVGSKDKQLYAFDLKTGIKLWQFTAGHAITASPAIGRGVLVIGDMHGSVYCFQPEKKD